jgi:crotonobetainyl-CoA:carnitine CoA-transferase CaiB-like acyl-CoA transferase
MSEGQPNYDRPYEGLRVIDMSQGVAGPYCGMLLAQQGADVIKIEPSDGDWARVLGPVYGDHTAFSIVANLGKRGVAIDLKHPSSQSIIEQLVAKADIFIEGFRPGVIDRLGYSYEHLQTINPRLLYLSVSGFGQTGPMRERPAMDPMLQAFTGFMSENTGFDGLPHRSPVIMFDMSTALYAQQAIAGALFARGDSNTGRKLEVSLMEAAANMQAVRLMSATMDGPFRRTAAPSGTFATRDGWLQMIVVKDRDFQKLCEAMDLQDWASDSRFQTSATRLEHGDLLVERLDTIFSGDTTEHWKRVLGDAGLQVEGVQSYPDFANHPQTEAVGAISWITQAGLDKPWPVPNVPALPKLAQGSTYATAPTIGQHTREVMLELGFSAEAIDQLFDSSVIS